MYSEGKKNNKQKVNMMENFLYCDKKKHFLADIINCTYIIFLLDENAVTKGLVSFYNDICLHYTATVKILLRL